MFLLPEFQYNWKQYKLFLEASREKAEKEKHKDEIEEKCYVVKTLWGICQLLSGIISIFAVLISYGVSAPDSFVMGMLRMLLWTTGSVLVTSIVSFILLYQIFKDSLNDKVSPCKGGIIKCLTSMRKLEKVDIFAELKEWLG